MTDAAKRGRLQGRHVVITGAGSGIGRATAQMFAADGAQLALLDRDEAALAETAQSSGGHIFVLDVTDEQAVTRVIGDAHAAMGALDGVVNSAGIMCADRLADTTLATWQRVIDVNLTGPFLVCRAARPFLAQRPGASIVNISSGQALLPGLTGGVYAASKAGVMVFTKSLAAELAPGIRANVICPGAATTPMGNAALDSMDAAARTAFIARYAIGRLSQPEEVAAAILFLISDEASSITGISSPSTVDAHSIDHTDIVKGHGMSQLLEVPAETIHPGSFHDPVQRARHLAPLIESLAGDGETEGTMPARLVAAFREAELFWLLLPKETGGGGADLITTIAAIEEISRADGSTGWSLMANMTGTALAGAFVGETAAHAMFGNGRRAITAGMLGPGGKAVAVDGGLRGSGDYAFGSGCAHADWFGAGMLVMENGEPRRLPNGMPEVRVCFVPREKVEILGNWDVMGLQGTGSYDYRVPDQVIANDFIMERTELIPRRGGPLFTLGIAGLACLGHAAVALGLMKRSLQEIARIATTKKRPAYAGTAAEHPIFLREFAIREAAAQSTRAFVINVFADAQDAVLAGGTLSVVQRARFRQCTTYLHEVAAEVVRFCYQWGGSSAQRMNSPLGRCMRDMGVATQHVFVDPVSLADAGIPLLADWNTRRD